MQTYKASITPLSAFGTRPLGDTLFGQLCWALRNRLGEERLADLLVGYTKGEPYVVVSDALPAGHFPRPVLPGHWFASIEGSNRKAAKKRVWLPADKFSEPVAEWLRHCVPGAALGGNASDVPHPHNAIDRRTGTTGEGFAPYSMARHWYGSRGDFVSQSGNYRFLPAKLDIYIALDEGRLTVDELRTALADIGQLGFGRDAGIGLGRFDLNALDRIDLPTRPDANAWLTLAPSTPQGHAWDAARSFYTVFTRFGRHGDMGVRLGSPFKTPVVLAARGAAFTPVLFEPRIFIGFGLGGDGSLSKSLPQTVHQGYAPVVGIHLPEVA